MSDVNIYANRDAQPEILAERIEPGVGFYAAYGKRLLDILLAVILLPVFLLPIAIACWIVSRDGGPALFGHVRVGQSGRKFRCWKIRSMVVDADRRLEEHLRENPEAAEEWARDFKLLNDPRITPLGNFLRKSSLDELPQIWNVITGEMSFVGPRPIVEAELEKYGNQRDAYLAAVPGVTGLWQVSGRNDISYETRVALDMEYLQNRSFLNDLKIMASTASAMIRQSGR
ncbi:sugar transferase [Aestuariibius sp. 2305UL40-4]|uniref:sugar transferase n=1 Tax=Aestuariibius violaceus TaxID=3234132 RepID=UPI00345E179F